MSVAGAAGARTGAGHEEASAGGTTRMGPTAGNDDSSGRERREPWRLASAALGVLALTSAVPCEVGPVGQTVALIVSTGALAVALWGTAEVLGGTPAARVRRVARMARMARPARAQRAPIAGPDPALVGQE